MINKNEFLIANDSYVKKDFYQIYPEILDLVNFITKRWDPKTSNESDPGVVLLKLLAFIADKNNYNIDKAILEAFMPSATQESSMRKLCDMMGYNMGYYKSGATDLSFMYQGNLLGTTDSNGKLIDEIRLNSFETSVTDENEEINYVLTEDVIITEKNEQKSVEAIEGTWCQCKAGDSNIIKLNNLDSNNRYYLPELMIAENGIWVKNTGESWQNSWVKIDNLNTQIAGSYVWKFGFDSHKNSAYIEFPNDIAKLIENGLEISYVRTTGANGNVSAGVLTKLVSDSDSNGTSLVEDDLSMMVVSNASATINGADYENLNQAYSNFKRTVGTFDTLVTCRDYANKIYQMVSERDRITPLVSNVQVSDIRDDINRSATVMTYDSFGVVFNDVSYREAVDGGKSGEMRDRISHFDLYIYPFNPITGSYTKKSFIKSFQLGYDNQSLIETNLEDYKTISHNIKTPSNNDIGCIKNKYTLKAKITTTYKVNSIEEKSILENIYTSLYKNFNMREIDFGEEIPFDTILSVIQNADTRIKNVSLEEPEISTYVYTKGTKTDELLENNREVYIKTLSKNILAGKTPLFDYNNTFKYEYGEQECPKDSSSKYDLILGYNGDPSDDASQISKITTEVEIPVPSTPAAPYVLKANEAIQMIAPNFKTTITYPAYINYYMKFATSTSVDAVAAEFSPVDGVTAGTFAAVNASTPLYYISSTGTITAGYLVDGDGNRYKKATQYFNANFFTPTTLSPTPSLGSNAVVSSIEANGEYKLQNGDILYINYTDSNDNVQNIKYEYDRTTTNGIEKLVDFNIIKPNFKLEDSGALHIAGPGKIYAKTSGFDGAWGIDGMYSLASNEQIEKRDYVKTTLKKSTPCYWLIKDGTIPFDTNHEYILQEGEYFFYTNDAKTELVILGSGTKLINTNYSNYTIDYTKKVDIDDISNNGLAAFASTDWKTMKFTESVYLEIQEMQFITLTEGDALVSISDPEVTTLTNTPQPITSASYNFKGEQPNYLPILPVGWEIKSRLDLNVGPELRQKLNDNQEIILYNVDGDVIETIKPYGEGDESGDVTNYPEIKTNYLLQVAGGVELSTPKVKVKTGGTTKEIYNLNILTTQYVSPTYTGSSGSETLIMATENNYYTIIDLKKQNDVLMDVIVPNVDGSANFALVMLYYTKGTSGNAILSCGDSLATDYLSYYNRIIANDPTYSISLEEGINVIKISNSCQLKISNGGDAVGSVIISNYSVVNNPNLEVESGLTRYAEGVNLTLLGLDGTTQMAESTYEYEYLLKLIRETAQGSGTKDLFYYNAPLDNSTLIDTDSMLDPMVWYDYNNVYNKFVISELDADSFEDGITLTKSSRL